MKLIIILFFAIIFLCGSNLFAQKTSNANLSISPNQAKLHIGEKKVVEGHFFKGEVRVINKRKHVKIVLLYMTDDNRTNALFVNIIKVIDKDNNGIIQVNGRNMVMDINKFSQENVQPKSKNKEDDLEAKGKIILFEGLPAIITNFKDMTILQPID